MSPFGKFSARFAWVMSTISLAFVVGCSSGPEPRPVTVEERVQFDRAIGLELAQQLEPQISVRSEPAVTAYLNRVGQTLADANPDLHLKSVGVKLVSEKDGKWMSFGLPGGRVYLPAGVLRGIEFENEVAAAIAVELAHVQLDHVLERIRKSPEGGSFARGASLENLLPTKPGSTPEKLDFFGPTGVFAYPEKAELDAADAAVGILYQSGYDPRGLVGLWNRYLAFPKTSPYEPSTLEKLLDSTRRAIAARAPLRNPIVRSQAFLSIRKKFEKL